LIPNRCLLPYQATRVRYPNKQVSKLAKESGLLFTT